MRKLLTILFCLVLVSVVVSASFDKHKQNTAYDLVIQSNNATNCNVSYIKYQDGTSVLLNLALTKTGNTFIRTIHANNFTKLGDTCLGEVCNDGSVVETGSKCIQVSPMGFGSTLTFYVIYLAILVGIFIMGISLKNTWVMMLGSIAVLILGFFVIINGIDLVKNTQTTWSIGLILWALGIYFIYLSVEEQLKAWD